MRKKQIIFLLVLLMVSLAQATDIPIFEKDPIEVDNSNPQITVTYQEPVNIILSYILRVNDNVQLNVNHTSDDNITFIMYPNHYLINQEYELHIISQDIIGNPSEVIQPFTITSPFMPIWLESPELGVSPTQVFDAVIRSEESAFCKYSTFELLPPPYINNYNFQFDINEETTHTILGINTDNSIYLNTNSPDEGGKERTIYIKCTDENELVHMASTYLAYDTSPPSLGVSITPNPIIDSKEPTAILEVQTSDRTVCTYSEGGENREFPNYNPDDFDSYVKEHFLTLDFTDLALRPIPQLFEEENFEYDITCTNLAGLTSDVASITLTVAFENEFSIKVNEPEPVTSDEIINLEIETNIQTLGGCRYGENSANTDFDEVIGHKIYRAELGALAEGSYTYNIECSDIGYQEKTYQFVVDRTKPFNVSIDMNQPLCSLDHITATLSAEDEFSDIDLFNYSISLGQDIIAEGSTTGEINEIVDLEANSIYQLNVVAYDEGGNFKEASISFTAQDESEISCDYEAPTTNIVKTPTTDGVLVKVNCFDSGSGCTDSFDYGLSFNGDDCYITASKYLYEDIIVTEDTNFCWRVYDYNNNNASDEEFVEYVIAEEAYPTYCFNNMTDGTETDRDCGGDCPVCVEEGSSCQRNSDCGTASCDPIEHICVVPSCNNEYKDGDESAIDCGGNCDLCVEGQECSTNNDCLSENCYFNICREQDYEANLENIDEPNSNPDIEPTINTNIQPKKSKAIPLTFIIIGLLLILCGSGFLYYETIKKPKSNNPRLISNKGLSPISNIEKDEEGMSIRERNIQEDETFAKRTEKKKEKRSKLIKEFQTEIGNESKEKELEKENQKETQNKDIITRYISENKFKKDNDEKFVSLEELKKESNLDEENIGKDVFQELEDIKKKTSSDKKEKEENKKEEKSKNENANNSDSQQTLNINKQEIENKDLKDINIKDLSTDDVFKKLAEMTGETNDNVKKVVSKNQVSSKDLMKVFANVTSKKQIDANVFKAILSQLLKRGQVSKQTISEIVFEFLDNELLTKKEVADILKEMNVEEKK